jgi:hypothetical protein
MQLRLTIVISLVAAVEIAAISGAASQGQPVLDYGFYKSRVEPIFLKKRIGHTRCVVCHAESNNAFRLEKLTPGSAAWNEEQSKRNFATVSNLVVPGDPATSRLLLQPLAPEAGGHVYHSGGRQFATKNDPDWKTLVQWINGAK